MAILTINYMVASFLALFTSIAFAQTTPGSAFPKIAEYLQLSNTQRSSLLINMDNLERTWGNRTNEVIRLTHEAAAETARPTLNELTIGRIYAAIEEQCRAARDDEQRTRELNLDVLTDLQRNRLQALSEARKLGPTIGSARSLFLVTADSFNPSEYPAGTQASYRPGCFLPSTLRAPDLETGDASAYLGLRTAQLRQIYLLTESLVLASYDVITDLQVTFDLILEATEQPAVDAATLGRHYATIENVCREWRAESANVRQNVIAVLDTAQRELLRPIEAAAQLSGAIEDAESTGLLPGFIDFSRGRNIFRIAGNPMDETCAALPLTTLFPLREASQRRITSRRPASNWPSSLR